MQKKREIIGILMLLTIVLLFSQAVNAVPTATIKYGSHYQNTHFIDGKTYSFSYIDTNTIMQYCGFYIWEGTGPRTNSPSWEKVILSPGKTVDLSRYPLTLTLNSCQYGFDGSAEYTLAAKTSEPECTDECSYSGQKQCEGTAGFKTCLLQDGCLKWSSINNCVSGWVCENGICNPKKPVCGDGSCDSGEMYNCKQDCDWCGDGECNAGETCSSCSQDCGICKKSDGQSCSYGDQCEGGYCVHYKCRSSLTYCGDGHCDPGENCKAENCCNGRHTNLNSDINNCGNCGKKCGSDSVCRNGNCINLNTDENCGWVGHRCAQNQECVNRQCRLKCGNGRKDPGENCKNCWQDVSCEDGRNACTQTGECVDLDSNENCGRIGNKCYDNFCVNRKCAECRTNTDCKARTEKTHTGRFRCTASNTGRYEILIQKGGNCKNYQCTGSTEVDGQPESCMPKPCHQLPGKDNAICGCHEDYDICMSRCLKKSNLEINDLCECDFQCKEKICDDNLKQCIKGLNIEISSSKATLNVGDEAVISLSVANPLDQDVVADITLNLGDGVELIEVLSGDQCAGSQCKSDKTTIRAGGKKDVTIKVRANSQTISEMNSLVTYHYGAKKIELEDRTSITIIECGNGKIEEGETFETCCIDAGCPDNGLFYIYSCNRDTLSCEKNIHGFFIYFGVGLIIFVLIVTFGAVYFKKIRAATEKIRLKRRIEKEKEEAGREKIFASQRRERFRIQKALKIVGDDVVSKKTAPSLLTIKKRIKKKTGITDFNDELLKEEYMDFVHEKDEEYKSNIAEEKAEKEKLRREKLEKEAKAKKKTPLFCKKCGSSLRTGAKFCKKCGARIKWF